MTYIPSTPTPEPAGDIRAQIAAVLDPAHRKRACFLVPQNAAEIPDHPAAAFRGRRAEGHLVTLDGDLWCRFCEAPSDPESFDRAMAEILDLPEAKPDIDERCHGNPALCRAVQARDDRGQVIHEAVTSYLRFFDTVAALQAHVPPGGQLAILHPAAALSRRVAMRQIDG